jgi:hypothetical protein
MNGICGPALIGEQGVMTTTVSLQTNVIYATSAHAPAPFSFLGVSVQAGSGTNLSCGLVLGVYNDGGGKPGARIGLISTTWASNTTFIFPFSVAGTYPAGDYWVAVRFTCASQPVQEDLRAGAGCAAVSDTSGTLPASWPSTSVPCTPIRSFFEANLVAQ